MNIVGNLKNGSVKIRNLKSEDGLHFSFNINVRTQNLSFSYNFGEVVYFRMEDFLNENSTKLQDVNYMGNFLELTKDYFCISINQNGAESNIKLDINQFEDQEILTNFLIELKAYYEVLRKK